MKFWRLQTLLHGYMCLGNKLSSSSSSPSWVQPELKRRGRRRRKQGDVEAEVVKVIRSDGVVNIYRRTITASELMLQLPKHLVCDSQSFYIGQKIPPLCPQDTLQLGHDYFLLPLHFFQSALSFVTIASSLATNKQPNMGGNCQVFVIKKAPSGCLQIRVTDEFISKLTQQGKIMRKTNNKDKAVNDDEEEEEELRGEVFKGVICTSAQLEKDYTQLVSFREWKPKLETIKEAKTRKLYSSFGIKRRRNKAQAVKKLQITDTKQIHKPIQQETRVQKMSAKIKFIKVKKKRPDKKTKN